jgi:hypothetical protein
MKNRVSIAVLAVFIVVSLCLGLLAGRRQHKVKTIFAWANEGLPQSDLELRLGHPWRDSACGEVFGGGAPSNCARELIYKSPLAPALPEYWAFRFDRSGKLVDKYHYVSP